MLQILGDILPLAVGVAVSPVPIIATILMLLSPRAGGTSLGFLFGWVLGITVALTIFIVLSSLIEGGNADGPRPIAAIAKLGIGALLILLAVRQWHSRPAAGDASELPKWMSAIDTMTPLRAAGLGAALAAANPKNLLLAASAGISIGASASLATTVGTAVIFVVIAAASVAAPVIAYLAAPARLADWLAALKEWLVAHNATIMAVLLLVIGVAVLGKGLATF
ncbi:GAP family protein [Leucobacter chromiireducens]|uniref:GAP family protein n=1 Tax=Leucobacter chromiireducens TaxID=283877 RepID=UPI003F80F4DA